MISNNGKKVQTAYELERKYNLRGIKKKVSESSEELTETKNSLTNIMTALLINLADVLDSQSDISLWFYSGIPTTSNEPYTSWATPEDHIGDLYYNTATGYVYKYTSNGWTEQDDKDLRRAMALSNVLLGTTDHERKVNFTTPTIPYYCGDWWIKEDGTLYICQTERTTGEYDSTDWINSAEYQSAVSMAMTDELGNSVLEVLSGTRIETTDKWVKFKNLANSGETIINGDNITTGEIESNNYVANTSGTKISLYDGTIDSKNFKVSSTGKVTATGVDISGEITATSGEIGGCQISNGVLQIDNANINSLSVNKLSGGSNNKDINFTGDIYCSNLTTGNNIYAGQNQSDYGLGDKYIHFTNNNYIMAVNNSVVTGIKTIGKDYAGLQVGNTELYLNDGAIHFSTIPHITNIGYLVVGDGIQYLNDHDTYMEVILTGGSAKGVNWWDSDKKLKDNIKDSRAEALPVIMNIEHKEFNKKDENNKYYSIGYIAQQLQDIDKDLVFGVSQPDGEEILNINVKVLVPYITKAIQEQQKEIEELKREIKELKENKNV